MGYTAVLHLITANITIEHTPMFVTPYLLLLHEIRFVYNMTIITCLISPTNIITKYVCVMQFIIIIIITKYVTFIMILLLLFS